MKSPFKRLSKKVKRGAIIALVTVGFGLAGIHVNPVLVGTGVDIGLQILDEATIDEQ